MGQAALCLIIVAALAAGLYANYAIMKLGRNEYAYLKDIVRQAIEDKSKMIVLIDPRPWHDAQGYNQSPVYDEQGRSLPAHELACFSSFCLQTGSIIHVLAGQYGLGYNAFEVLAPRGDTPVPGLKCEMLTAPQASYPPGASEHSIKLVEYYRTLAPITCVMTTLAWHDLGVDFRRK